MTMDKSLKFRKLLMIKKYDDKIHRTEVVELWTEVFGYTDLRNSPGLVIDKKLAIDQQLYIAEIESKVIGTVMAGYDGHRGWIYSLAVLPEYRSAGVGTLLLQYAEAALSQMGCMKINLQIMAENKSVKEFYIKNGYMVEERVSMGKQLSENIPDGVE